MHNLNKKQKTIQNHLKDLWTLIYLHNLNKNNKKQHNMRYFDGKSM